MAEYILSPSKADSLEWHILLAGEKSLIQTQRKADGTFHTESLLLHSWLVAFRFSELWLSLSRLLLSFYFRSDVWHLKLKSKGVIIRIDHCKMYKTWDICDSIRQKLHPVQAGRNSRDLHKRTVGVRSQLRGLLGLSKMMMIELVGQGESANWVLGIW